MTRANYRSWLPTRSDPAVVVVTPPDMRPRPAAIPKELEEFAAAWTLTSDDRVNARLWGIPGL